MIKLPTCRWRGIQRSDSKFPCRCPKFINSPNNVVPAEICGICPYVDCEESGDNATPPSRPVIQNDCIHLGQELRTQECPTCAGTVKIKVFACSEHGECTAAKKLSGIACCNAPCGQYQKKE